MNNSPNGTEWLIEAFDCAEDCLRSQDSLTGLFSEIVSAMHLSPVGKPLWHQFPLTAGLTGVWLLQESHLAIHTFPEHSSACLNLFCCRRRESPDWSALLTCYLGAGQVLVRECERHYMRSRVVGVLPPVAAEGPAKVKSS
ncbi:MAG: S-adenosylmethionine decarboxylase [Acidobacteriota bacterium]